jgi:hypothetical protein
MADIAIRLNYGETESCLLYHYPGSTRGQAVASKLASRLAPFPPCPEIKVAESAEIFLQQTNCPAVTVLSASLEDRENADLLLSPRWLSAQTQQLLLALIDYFSGSDYRPVTWSCTVFSGGRPVAGASVTINGSITVMTGEDGKADFTCFGEGIHSCSVIHPDGRYSIRQVEIVADGSVIIDD